MRLSTGTRVCLAVNAQCPRFRKARLLSNASTRRVQAEASLCFASQFAHKWKAWCSNARCFWMDGTVLDDVLANGLLVAARPARFTLLRACFFIIFAPEERLPRRAPKKAVCFYHIRTTDPSFLCVVVMARKGEMAPVNRTEETAENVHGPGEGFGFNVKLTCFTDHDLCRLPNPVRSSLDLGWTILAFPVRQPG
jgi:hypothetical protein